MGDRHDQPLLPLTKQRCVLGDSKSGSEPDSDVSVTQNSATSSAMRFACAVGVTTSISSRLVSNLYHFTGNRVEALQGSSIRRTLGFSASALANIDVVVDRQTERGKPSA